MQGCPTEQELEGSWQEIETQYSEAMGSGDHRVYFSLHKQILQKEISLRQVNLAIMYLQNIEQVKKHPAGVVTFEKFLNETFYTDVHLDLDDEEDYDERIGVWRNMKASILLNIDLKRMEYDAIGEKLKSGGSKPTRAYFQTILLNMSDYAGYLVDDKMSTFEFCERFRRLEKFLEKNK